MLNGGFAGGAGLRAVLVVLVAMLAAGAIVPSETVVRDLVTGETIPELTTERVDPNYAAATAPLFGFFVDVISKQHILALAAWLFVLPLLVMAFRAAGHARRGALFRGLGNDALWATGAFLPLALLPLPLGWSNALSSSTMKWLTPFGIPGAVLFACAVWIFCRPQHGHRGRRLAALGGRFVGILGLEVLVVLFAAKCMPGLHRAQSRLVRPAGHYVADLHAHSNTRKDALMGAADRLALYDSLGIQLTAVTEHNFLERRRGDVDDYFTIRALAKDGGHDVVPIPGQEFTTHAFHAVILGGTRSYQPRAYRLPNGKRLRDAPPTYGIDVERLVRDVHADGGYVIVAHWWTPMTWYRVDWQRLIDLGVDGFEIFSGSDWAPRHLIDAWQRAGMFLVAASDFHDWRKSIHCWNLVDAAAVNPDGLPLDQIDPQTLVDRMIAKRAVRPIAAVDDWRDIPLALIPPIATWRYFAGLAPAARIAWFLAVLCVWTLTVALRRPAPLRRPALAGSATVADA